MNSYYVYILANKRNGTLYTGLTSDVFGRTYQHREELVDGFTRKYHIHRLVYYEEFADPEAAINREKCIKRWKRQWKLNLIEKENPGWRDLYQDFLV